MSIISKKYKLTNETTVVYRSTTLHRIQALKDFGDVKKGDLGGFVESDENLSQEGNAWIYGDAMVFGNAKVYGNAEVHKNALVYDNAEVYENAKIYGNACVYDEAKVYGNACIYGDVQIFGSAKVYDNALAHGSSIVLGTANVHGGSRIFGDARVYDNTNIFGTANVLGNANVHGDSQVSGGTIRGDANVRGDAVISCDKDYIVFKNWWSSGRYFTWTRSNDMWSCGCFYGTGKELIEKAYKDSELSGQEYERIVNYVESIKSKLSRIDTYKMTPRAD